MKLYTEIYLLLILSTFAIDFILYKQSKKRILITKVFIFSSTVLFFAGFTWIKLFYKYFSIPELPLYIMWFDFLFLLIYFPKLILISAHFIQTKWKINQRIVRLFSTSIISLSLVIICAGAFLFPQKISITTIEIPFEKLPDAYNNYSIVQFSDVHLGSRTNQLNFLKKIVTEINRQKPDMVVFTGDMVNNFASEMQGYDSLFLQIRSKDGNFAVLGNHDYGDYTVWDSPEKKTENLKQVKKAFKRFGFRLLNNESVTLHTQNDSIELIGVENFSKKSAKNYADLQKAIKNTNKNTFKLLLSHNPEHWELEILPQTNIDLTLSGHTHAAQMGIKVFGKVYSPAVFLYKQFNGLYEKEEQKIYVSRGVGFIGLPVMMGLYPEITVIKLKK